MAPADLPRGTAAFDHPQLRAMLERDAVWAAYALADLQPDFAPYCAWYPADDERGLAMIYTGLSIPTLFTAGDPASVAASMTRIELPERIYITVREEHFPAVDRHYDFSADQRPMRRMMLPAREQIGSPQQAVVRLTTAMSDALCTLYGYGGDFAPDAFDPYQIENGVFFGIMDGDELVAAGGTHIVDWSAGIAAIGNMYTRPDARGRGHAGAIVQALAHTLRAGDVSTIVLNVDQRNAAAYRLYLQHGFLEHCPYVEGIGIKRD